jgi:hypothetical protein
MASSNVSHLETKAALDSMADRLKARPDISISADTPGTPMISRITDYADDLWRYLGVFSGQLPSGRHYPVATR